MGKITKTIKDDLRKSNKFMRECDRLEKEVSGKESEPVFKTEDILSHMSQNPGVFSNPVDAYLSLHKEELSTFRPNPTTKANLAEKISKELFKRSEDEGEELYGLDAGKHVPSGPKERT